MKKVFLISLINLIFSGTGFSANRYWVAASAGDWNNTLNWSVSSGGAGGASVPTTGDFVFFDGNSLSDCNLDVDAAFDGINLTGYTGIIDLNGFSFNPSVSGTEVCTFSEGTINDTPGTSEINFTTSNIVYFSGTTFGTAVIVTADRIIFSGSTFNELLTATQNGGANTSGSGGCTFNGTTTITNAGSGFLLMANVTADVFNADVTFSNSGTSTMRIAQNGLGNAFNENIILNCTDGGGIFFGDAGGTSTLADTKTISIGVDGFTSGELRLRSFTQLGATPQTLLLTTDALLRIDNASVFNGAFTGTSPRILISESTFNGVAAFEKTGGATDFCNGGSIFMSDLNLTNSGSGTLVFSNGSPDEIQGDLIAVNSGTANLHIAYNSAGNTVDGDVLIENIGTGNNFYCSNTAVSSLVVGGNLTVNSASADAGTNIYIANNGSIEILGNLEVNQNATGDNANFYLANSASSSAEILGTAKFFNNGLGVNSRRMYLGSSGDVIFNDSLIIENNSDANGSEIYLNRAATSVNEYNEHIVISMSVDGGDGIRFGENGGSGTLAATKNITIGGDGFIDGVLRFENFTQLGTNPQTLVTTDDARVLMENTDWGGNLSITTPRIETRGSIFRGTVYLEKTGPSNDNSYGGNTFEQATELKSTGSNNFLMGNVDPDEFLNGLIMNNEGEGNMYIAYNSPGNIIVGDLLVNNLGTGTGGTTVNISSNTLATLTIDGDVTINNMGDAQSTNCYFSNVGDITLNGDLYIDHSPTGTNGYVYLADNAAANLTINGNTELTIGTTGGTTKRTYISRSGTTVFNGSLEITNSGNASNNQVYLNSNLTGNNTFNGDIILASTHPDGDGFFFGDNGGLGTLSDTYTVTVGAGGFLAGDLYFRNFNQVGTTPQALTLTGDAYIRNYESDWGGAVDFIAPRVNTRDTRYRGVTYLEKTGAINDASAGGNIFNENTTLRNSGSDYFMMGNGNFDLWDADLTIENVASDHIYIAHNSAGNVILGDLSITAATVGLTTQHIYLCTNTASTLEVNGNALIDNVANASGSNIYIGENGDIDFLGDVTITNATTGENGDIRIANNTESEVTIAGNTTISNDGAAGTSKRVFVGYNGDIIFNGLLTLFNNSDATNSEISLNERANSVNLYNEDIILNCAETDASGIYFGRYDGAGTLATGKTVSLGLDDFYGENLYFRNFTQLGPTPQSLAPAGSTRFESYDSEWNGAVEFTSENMFSRGTLYNGPATLEKTGAGNDSSPGGNTFNGAAVFINSGDGYLMLANNVANDFNDDITYRKTAAGLMYPTYNTSSTYAGDIIIDAATVVTFGAAGNGRVILDGTTAQAVNVIGATPMPIVRDLETQNNIDEITLNTPVEVISELELVEGNLITTLTNILYMRNNSSVIAVSDNAFVDGPVEKIGNDPFVFPVGKLGVYRPIEMVTGPASGSAQFRAEYFPNDVMSDGISDWPLDDGIHHISDCEYWILDRTVGTNPVVVALYYKDYSPDNCSGVENQTDLLVARWNGSFWQNHGNGGFGGVPEDGWIQTLGAVTDFSPFTLATLSIDNPLPIELLDFSAKKKDTEVVLSWTTASELNNDYFIVERSIDGEHFEAIGKINGAGNSSKQLSYELIDVAPKLGVNYYRLKQVDFDGAYSYADVRSINFIGENDVQIFPNPAYRSSKVSINSSSTIQGIDVYDEAGRLLIRQNYNGSENRQELDVLDFSSGILYLHITTNTGVTVKKLIIQ
jgi:hypothetical protein